MHQVGQTATHDEVTQAVAARDAQDRSRPEAPLVRAAEARVIDTTDLTVDDVVQIMVSEMQLNFLQSDG
jgi:cytidylate kinase